MAKPFNKEPESDSDDRLVEAAKRQTPDCRGSSTSRRSSLVSAALASPKSTRLTPNQRESEK